MKRALSSILSLAVVLAVALAISACSRHSNDPKDRVDKALDSANIKGVHTTYDRDADVVHLQGTVDSVDAKQRAEQVATGAVGTSGKVLDELEVQGMDEKPAADQDALIRDTLRNDVKEDPVLQDRDINFDVNNGVVTIKGNVRTAQEKAKVSQLVQSVNGVKQMANELDIKPGK